MPTKRKERTAGKPTCPKPMRLWPGVVAAILLLLVKFIVPMIIADALAIALFGGLIFGFIIIVWWTFFSRVPLLDRGMAIAFMIIAFIAVQPFLHESIAKAGMGMLFPILAIPILCLAFVAWALVSRRFPAGLRRVTMIATILLSVGFWTLMRTEGLNNDGDSDFAWRWTETSEGRLLAQAGRERATLSTRASAAAIYTDWPGFRGAKRDGIIHGTTIETDWSTFPPEELWRRPVGPGWSSFAVMDDLLYTQEQRGEQEVISCYSITTGEPVWLHQDETRFWESNSGAGPRGTPTLNNGRVYALGGTGILNVLDAGNGNVIWSRNAANDTDTKTPYWGFAGSPLVLHDIVIASVAGSLVAYDLNTGEPRWSKQAGGDCYSSPHLAVLDDVEQILLQNEAGVISLSPKDGALLWEHSWPGNPIVQPAVTANGDLLVSIDDRSGIRRISVEREPDGWSIAEMWTSDRLKPYFNDSVIHNGYVYGFDGPKLTCLDIANGRRKWKGGRYGRGQFILLADQNILLVISEKGDIALVEAVPDQFTELARFPALEGKTWNHPVLVRDILLVRNAKKMAAFRLSPKKDNR